MCIQAPVCKHIQTSLFSMDTLLWFTFTTVWMFVAQSEYKCNVDDLWMWHMVIDQWLFDHRSDWSVYECDGALWLCVGTFTGDETSLQTDIWTFCFLSLCLKNQQRVEDADISSTVSSSWGLHHPLQLVRLFLCSLSTCYTHLERSVSSVLPLYL